MDNIPSVFNFIKSTQLLSSVVSFAKNGLEILHKKKQTLSPNEVSNSTTSLDFQQIMILLTMITTTILLIVVFFWIIGKLATFLSWMGIAIKTMMITWFHFVCFAIFIYCALVFWGGNMIILKDVQLLSERLTLLGITHGQQLVTTVKGFFY